MADPYGYSTIDDLINEFGRFVQSSPGYQNVMTGRNSFTPPVVNGTFRPPANQFGANAPQINMPDVGASTPDFLSQLSSMVASRVAPQNFPMATDTFTSNPGVTPQQNPVVAQAAATVNSWRLQSDFYDKLQALAKQVPGVQIFSGGRTVERQNQLFQEALKKYGSVQEARKHVAPGGSSQHNFGLAADLKFDSPAVRDQVNQVASQYGLSFPMSWEPWHVEPAGSRDANGKPIRGNATPLTNESVGGGRMGASIPVDTAPSNTPLIQPSTTLTANLISNINPDISWIIQRESGWRTDASPKPTKDNPNPTAFGLGQLIIGHRQKYAKALGVDPNTTDPNQQLAMMLMYVKDRYGSPAAARRFWEQHKWY